jgi:hypothetical protein
LSRSRGRLPLEVHERVFAWVLERLAERGLVKGARIGVDEVMPTLGGRCTTTATASALTSARRRCR